MKARAFAKVNLSLEVGGKEGGLHSLRGIYQSISWHDDVEVSFALEDRFEVPGGGAPPDTGNLAWRALVTVREMAGSSRPVEVVLHKRIPMEAGLGGGSADAAAVVALGAQLFGLDPDPAVPVLLELGSDVPFSMVGGTALVQGTGDLIEPLPPLGGFALAIVVPPVELNTVTVFRRWDELGEPSGPAAATSSLPPTLRSFAPLRNDLYPAAVSLAPAIEDWRAELAHRWGVPVAMTGSGSALYGFFATVDEAREAADATPAEARAASAAEPVDVGWDRVDAGAR
jgi:4-diphosphocytidyl-2-C-methyl-D-erythritol kinase